MATTNSPTRFRSQVWSNRSTEPDPESTHARRGKRPGPCDVSRSWHAGCDAMDRSGIHSNSTPVPSQYGFGALFRAGPLPVLPANLIPGEESPASANVFISGRLGASGTPNRIRTSASGTGRIKVILCVQRLFSHPDDLPTCPSHVIGSSHSFSFPSQPLLSNQSTGLSVSPCIGVDPSRGQITLIDPNPIRRRGNSPVPKQFIFDAVLTKEIPMTNLCSLAISDTIRAVLRGQDGCILTIGHKRTGKSYSMFGSDRSVDRTGVIPHAIAWLFQLLSRQKEINGIRFSVRVSAVEVYGMEERFRDLLSDALPSTGEEINLEICSPSQYLSPSNYKQSDSESLRSEGDSVAARTVAALTKRSEIRASSADKAAHLLDLALSNRAHVRDRNQSSGLSHMLFTLHLYQCRVEQNEQGTSVSGGRTRLHFLDLGCGRYAHHASSSISLDQRKQSRGRLIRPMDRRLEPALENAVGNSSDPHAAQSTRCLSLSAMANVLLALLTGQRHLPFRDSALTYVLREAMSGNQVQPCILAHVSASTQHYTETLQVVQLAAKLSRLRKRRVGVPGSGIHLAESYASSPSESTSLEDTASSSVESSSQSNGRRERLYRRRYKGPRMGRSSYARSVSSLGSDLDFTSGSEQSCDTVIYLGSNSHNTGGGTREHRPTRRLGPRGMADGSVDMPSNAIGQKMFSECLNSHDDCSTEAGDASAEHRLNLNTSSNSNHASIGPVKRMMPRTNATVWPRSMSFRRAKESLDAHTETWVDGPKAMVTVCSPEVNTHESDRLEATSNDVNQHGTSPYVSLKLEENRMTSEMRINWSGGELGPVQTVVEHSQTEETANRFTASQTVETQISKSCSEGLVSIDEAFALLESGPSLEQTSHKWDLLNYRLLSLDKPGTPSTQQDDNLFGLDVSESSCQSASSSSTLERDARLLPRALSDISERTEETEGITDCATMPRKTAPTLGVKSHTLQTASRSQCLRSNSLDPIRSVFPIEASIKLMELRKQIQSASCQGGEELINNSASMLPDHSHNPPLSSPITVTCAPPTTLPVVSVHLAVSTMSPKINTQVSGGSEQNKENIKLASQLIAFTSEQDKNVNSTGISHPELDRAQERAVSKIPNPKTNHQNPSKETQTKIVTKSLREEYRRGSVPSGSRRQNPHVTGGNSLLRVAAWVNSIGMPSTEDLSSNEPQTPHRSNQVTVIPEQPTRTDSYPRHAPLNMDLTVSPGVYPQSPMGISTFGKTFSSPKSDRIHLREPLTSSASSTRHVTPPNAAMFSRPSLPISSPSLHSDLERNSPILWYNSSGCYFSLEPSSIPDRNFSHHPSSFNPSHSISPRHQWLTTGQDLLPPEEKYHTTNAIPNRSIPLAVTSVSPESFNLPILSDSTDNRFLGSHSSSTVAPMSPVRTQPSNHIVYSPPDLDTPELLGSFSPPNNEEQKNKRKSRLRFLTLPLFRGLRIRHREQKKGKKEKSSWTATPEVECKTHELQSTIATPSYPSDSIPYSHCAWFDATQSNMTNATQSGSFGVCMGPTLEVHHSPLRPPQPTDAHIPNSQFDGMRARQGWISTLPLTDKQSRSSEDQIEVRRRCISPQKIDPSWSPWHVRKCERDSLPEDLPNSPSGPLNASGYTGGLLASVYRSGRRSVAGGAASSGYESMRFGASDLSSLSHPDSASDCSGLVSSKLVVSKEVNRCALCTEAKGHGRRNSSAAIPGRAHGSTGSIGLTNSPTGQHRLGRTARAQKITPLTSSGNP